MLLCLSANHRTARFEVLEQLSTGDATLAQALIAGTDMVAGAVVLATCNRFEAYLEIDEPLTGTEAVALEAVAESVSASTGLDPELFRESITVLQGTRVAEHLFSVSSGLESVVVGEDEISGQVRRALEAARTSGTTSRDLERLFQRAAQTSRTIKNSAGLGSAGRSLVRLALDLVESRIADWAATRVLLIGTGSYARTSIAALRERGVVELALHSPTGRGAELAAKRDLALITAENLAAELGRADVIVSCTSGSGVIEAETISTARSGRESGQLVIDLGLPRNVDPAVAAVAGIELLDLELLRLHAPIDTLQAPELARELVSRAARKFETVAREHTVSPALVRLREHVLDLVDAEIERARKRGDSSDHTEQALRHLASVLLHTPSVRARELAAAGEGGRFQDAVAALFNLTPASGVLTELGSGAANESAENRNAG